METVIHATYDGKAIVPDSPVALPPNTRVVVSIEEEAKPEKRASFIATARSLRLSGPADWSERVDEYLDSSAPNG